MMAILQQTSCKLTKHKNFHSPATMHPFVIARQRPEKWVHFFDKTMFFVCVFPPLWKLLPEMQYWSNMLSRKSWKLAALANLCQCIHREGQCSNWLEKQSTRALLCSL